MKLGGSLTALVTDIQGYSVHDGPGIRTVVFLKGCGLQCWWCSNPECILGRSEIGFFRNLCTNCGDCAEVCPSAALTISHAAAGPSPSIDRALCNGCGACAAAVASKRTGN